MVDRGASFDKQKTKTLREQFKCIMNGTAYADIKESNKSTSLSRNEASLRAQTSMSRNLKVAD